LKGRGIIRASRFMENLISTSTIEFATDTEIIISTTTGTSSVLEVGTTTKGTTTAVAYKEEERFTEPQMLLTGGGGLDYQMISAVFLLGWFLIALWKFIFYRFFL